MAVSVDCLLKPLMLQTLMALVNLVLAFLIIT